MGCPSSSRYCFGMGACAVWTVRWRSHAMVKSAPLSCRSSADMHDTLHSAHQAPARLPPPPAPLSLKACDSASPYSSIQKLSGFSKWPELWGTHPHPLAHASCQQHDAHTAVGDAVLRYTTDCSHLARDLNSLSILPKKSQRMRAPRGWTRRRVGLGSSMTANSHADSTPCKHVRMFS